MRRAVNLRNQGTSGRIMEAEIEHKRFSTPARVVNNVEKGLVDEFFAMYSSGVLSGEIPPCEIQETVLDFNDSTVEKLCNRNEEVGNRTRFISTRNKNRESRLKISNIRFMGGTEWNEEAVKLLTKLQIDSKCLDLISVPDPIYNDSSTFSLIDAYEVAREVLDERGLDNVRLLPNLDLATEPPDLETRLKELIDMGLDCIAFRHRPRTYASALRVSRLLSDKDVWVHLSGVRKKMVDGTVPAIHIQPLYSFDSVSAFKGYRPGGSTRSYDDGRLSPAKHPRKSPDVVPDDQDVIQIITPPSDPFLKLARFDASVLGILNKFQHLALLGPDLNCECLLCRGKDTHTFYDYGLDRERVSRSKFRIHQTLHELWASQNEFVNARTSIIETGYNTYLRQKPVIQANEHHIEGLISQTTLDDFMD